MAKKPISQSDTRWVKKEGKRGYVEQISTGKRVTGKVKLSADTTKGKAGETQRYKAGVGKKASPLATGAGTTGGKPKSPPAGSSSTSRSNPARPPASPPAKKTAAQRQNKDVKVGTIKVGAKGKQANRWNGKRWVPVAGSKTGYATSVNGAASSSLLSKWNSLTAEQKRRYSGNIQKYAKAMGINPTAAAAKVVGGPNSTLAKAAGAATSGSSKPPAGGGMSGQGGKWKYVNGRWVPSGSAAAKPTGPKKGDKKTTMSGVAVWDGSKWVKAK